MAKKSKTERKIQVPKKPKPPKAAWENWSATKLTTALECPLRCFFDHILEEQGYDNPLAASGKTLHELFRKFFSKTKKGKFFYPLLKNLLGAHKGLWWRAVAGKHGFGGFNEPVREMQWDYNRQEGFLFVEGQKILKKFRAKFHKLRMDGTEHWPEKRFKFKLNGLTFSGIVDRLDIGDEGVLITDYKRGRYSKEKLQKDIQMTIYYRAGQKCFSEPTNKPFLGLRIYNYLKGEEQIVPVRTEEDYSMIAYLASEASAYYKGVLLTGELPEEKIIPRFRRFLRDDIPTGDIIPRFPQADHCRFCGNKVRCDNWVRGIEFVDGVAKPRRTAREIFWEKQKEKREAWQPNQVCLSLTELPLVKQTTALLAAASEKKAEQLCLAE